MIHYIKGDLLQSKAEALVNTVNTVGVMGKGIALQFKEAFPNNTKKYIAACKNNSIAPGILLVTKESSLHSGNKTIINFPTKTHWRSPSKYNYVEEGLKALVELLKSEKIGSIAIPPLGCGNGGLDWNIVKPLIEKYLSDLDSDIYIYEPNTAIKELLQRESKSESKLTPSRAVLIYTLFLYENQGEYASLFSANKLAYFLQRMGQHLKLDFKAHHYGPYAIGVEKVLYSMNGVYLTGLEQGQAKPFEPLMLNYEKFEEVKTYINNNLSNSESLRLSNLIKFLTGFTSELSLEILATVDFVLSNNPNFTLEEVQNAISKWNMRKKELFKKEYISIAYNHIKDFNSQVQF